MSPMIQNRFRAPVTAFITPIAKGMLKLGLTPNSVTAVGAIGGSIAAIYFFSIDEFFIGTLVVALFALSDLFDGTMARLSNPGSTRWGALIDSTLDRITDAAIFIGILIYAYESNSTFISYLAIYSLVTGALIPYIRAKAESLGIDCSVGIAERAERLIIVLIGTGLYGLGIDQSLAGSLLIISFAGTITIFQRMHVVYRAG